MLNMKVVKLTALLISLMLVVIACTDNSSEAATATALADRATALAESINSLEVEVGATQQAEQEKVNATATQFGEQTATAAADIAIIEGETATAEAIVRRTATREAVEYAGATATSEANQPTLESIAEKPEIPPGYTLILSDTFDNNVFGWPVEHEQSDDDDIYVRIEDGYLECSFDVDMSVYWLQAPDGASSLSEFYVSVEAQRVGGTGGGYYGVAFRYTNMDSFYLFEVDDLNQRFWVHARIDNAWHAVFSGVSNDIKPNEVNRLAVVGEGSTFTLYVNDVQLGQVEDRRIESGKVGLSLNLPELENSTRWRFDNLVVFAPEN